MQVYLSQFQEYNGRVKAMQAKPAEGIVTDHDVATPNEMAKSPFYQDFDF